MESLDRYDKPQHAPHVLVHVWDAPRRGDDAEHERRLHRYLHAAHVEGEYFRLSKQVLARIIGTPLDLIPDVEIPERRRATVYFQPATYAALVLHCRSNDIERSSFVDQVVSEALSGVDLPTPYRTPHHKTEATS